jgi:hypothetical protein
MHLIMQKLINSNNLIIDDIKSYDDFLFAIEYSIKYSKYETLVNLLNHFQDYTNFLRHNRKEISKRYNISYELFFIQYSFYLKNKEISQMMLDLFEYDLDINVYTNVYP